MKTNFANKIVVFTGPSAVGKDTVEVEVMKVLPLKKVVTTTTRPPRPGEKRGVNRHFVTKARFREMIKQDLLIEHNYFNGHYYGTQWKDMRRPAAEGQVPLLDVDPNEATNIQKRNPDALVVFLKAESLAVLKKRLVARGGTQSEINERLRLAKEAMMKESSFAYSVVNHEGKLAETVRIVKKIIRNYLGL
ncbi:MAG: guanylate kinase [Patescibacteria group bacterium]